MSHPSTARFREVLDEMWELHVRKGEDYGTDADPFLNVRNSESFGMPAWVGAVLRAQDKMVRIQKAARQVLSGDELSMRNEGLEDSLIDLANYAAIALVLLRDGRSDRPSIEEAFDEAVVDWMSAKGPVKVPRSQPYTDLPRRCVHHQDDCICKTI